MEEFLAPEIWPLLTVAIVWWILSLFPVFCSVLAAFRRRGTMPRKCLFVGVVTCLSYGLFMFFLFAVNIPLSAFSVYIAPQLQVVGHLPSVGLWLVQASDMISDWWWLAVPLPLAAGSLLLARYLAPRWSSIVAAL